MSLCFFSFFISFFKHFLSGLICAGLPRGAQGPLPAALSPISERATWPDCAVFVASAGGPPEPPDPVARRPAAGSIERDALIIRLGRPVVQCVRHNWFPRDCIPRRRLFFLFFFSVFLSRLALLIESARSAGLMIRPF